MPTPQPLLIAAAAVAVAVIATIVAERRRDGTASDTPAAAAQSRAPCPRPYDESSPWNTPIGPEPVYDRRSPQHIAELREELTSDPTQYTYPVYEVTASTPRVTVRVDGRFSDVDRGGGRLRIQREGSIRLPIPADARPAEGSDAQIVLLDRSSGDEWGAWRLREEGGGWRIENGYHYNTGWDAVPPQDDSGRPFGSRGSGIPYLAGLVRPCEIERRRIDHALAFAYDYPAGTHVYPATKSDGKSAYPDLPEGARLQLDPSLTGAHLAALGCDGPCLTIARALQQYGMFVVDASGRPKVMMEYEGTARWAGTVDSDTVRPIPLSSFRVLKSCGIVGTRGPDTIRGTRRQDVICARGGRDHVTGGGGDDVVYGEDGADRLVGGSGDDRLHGNGGNDRLDGGRGRDVLLGGGGADRLLARDGGRDVLSGGPGPDRIAADRRDRRIGR